MSLTGIVSLVLCAIVRSLENERLFFRRLSFAVAACFRLLSLGCILRSHVTDCSRCGLCAHITRRAYVSPPGSSSTETPAAGFVHHRRCDSRCHPTVTLPSKKSFSCSSSLYLIMKLSSATIIASLGGSAYAFQPATLARRNTALHGFDLSGNSWKPDSEKMGSTDTGDYFPEGYNPDEVNFTDGWQGSQELLTDKDRGGPQLYVLL